jgi:hypothetical protein
MQRVHAVAQVSHLQRDLELHLVELVRKTELPAEPGKRLTKTMARSKVTSHVAALVDHQRLDRVSCGQPSAHQVDVDDAHARLYVSALQIRQGIMFNF